MNKTIKAALRRNHNWLDGVVGALLQPSSRLDLLTARNSMVPPLTLQNFAEFTVSRRSHFKRFLCLPVHQKKFAYLSEMIKEIVANIKTDDLEILFRMDSGYFDEDIIETIELLGCKYLIKAKEYPTLVSQVTDPPILFVTGDEGRETAELFTKLNTWKKDRRFIISRVLKPEKERAQLSLLDGDEYQYFFFVTNTELPCEKVVISYEKRGNAENYIKEARYDMAVGHLLLKSFWANEAVFQMMMLAYNLFLLFKFDSLHISEYRPQIKTFRLKVVFLAAKIIRTARYVVMKLSAKYPYQDVYKNCLS